MRKEIMGVSFDDVTLPQAIAAGEELAKGPGCAYVVTPNPEIVNMARQDPAYGAILNGAGLVLPDGIGVVHAAKILGTPLQGGCPASTLPQGLWPAWPRRVCGCICWGPSRGSPSRPPRT